MNLIVRAAAAAELTADTPAKHRAHGSSHGHFDFPFPGVAAALNELTLSEDIRLEAGKFLGARAGGTRLVHSGLVHRSSAVGLPQRAVHNSEGFEDVAASTIGAADIYAHEAFTLVPTRPRDAVIVYVPLSADEDMADSVLFVQLDSQQRYPQATAAVKALLRRHHTLRIIVRREEAEYIQCDSWTSVGLTPDMMAPLSVLQRTLLQIPAPGHQFWTVATVAATAARYPGLDPSPYLAAPASREGTTVRAARAAEFAPPGADGDDVSTVYTRWNKMGSSVRWPHCSD